MTSTTTRRTSAYAGTPRARGGLGVAAALAAAAFALGAGGASAQVRDSIPGVALGLVYEAARTPGLAIRPFTGRLGGAGIAPQVEAIVGRDLGYSNRFQIMDSLPAGMLGEGIDYRLWDRLGADWLLTGQVEGAGDGFLLTLELHDVVYARLKEVGRFRIPQPAHHDFRMSVHRASDQVVQWATGEPGMAASRIAFSLTDAQGNKDIWVIDSDGENLRRITNYASITISPAWHPSGEKIAFTSFKSGNPRIYELDLNTSRERTIPGFREGTYISPAYHPDGQTIAFSVSGGTRSGLFTYNLARDCCLAYISGGPRWDDLSPSYSPDGGRLVFNTNRFGTTVPQIMVMPAQGGDPEMVSPFEFGRGGYYSAPEWNPLNDLVAFHGAIRRGTYHILVADLRDRGRRIRQLTWEGNNEDPSWAPDGRHLVFIGERQWGQGLFVVDAATGRMRTLVSGRNVTVPAWSPALRPSG